MGDTYSDLNIGHYNREAMISIETIVDAMSVQTITETIECVDGSDSLCRAYTRMYEKRFDVLGVCENGRVVGYVPRSCGDMHLSENTLCSIVMRETAAEFGHSTFDPSLKLYDALQQLTQRQRLFIRDAESGDVVGIVTRADLQKAPIRMMIFGYATVFEIHLTEAIRRFRPQDAWVEGVSPRDGQKRDYCRRKAAGEEMDLLDCLDFGQKIAMAEQTPGLLTLFNPSDADVSSSLSDIRILRNAVAHGSSLANRNRRWEKVAQIVQDMRALDLHFETADGEAPPSSQRSERNARNIR